MGWDYTHRERGTSNLDYFRRGWGEGYELLDGATVGGVFYGALRLPGGKVTATVTLTKWVPSDYFNFGKKDMMENWGPNDSRCPDRILDMLSPAEDVYVGDSLTYAKEWRQRCRENNARVAKVKRGSVVLHAGSRYVAVDLRRNLFKDQSGRLLRWSWWRSSNDLQVVA